MDKRLFASIGLKFDRPRWQVYLRLLLGGLAGIGLLVFVFSILFVAFTLLEGLFHA